MITVEKKRLGFSVKPCVLSLQFEMQIMSHELKRGMCYPSVPRVLCSQCAVAHQRQRIRKAIPAVCRFYWGGCVGQSLSVLGSIDSLCTLFICASGVCPLTTIHHSLLSLPVSIFLRVSTRETLGVAT